MDRTPERLLHQIEGIDENTDFDQLASLELRELASRRLIGLFESSAVSELRIIEDAQSWPSMIDSRSKRWTCILSVI
jgi:hypothetical protein